MSARLAFHVGICLLLGLGPRGDGPGIGAAAEEEKDDAIPDKVGAEVHMSKDERKLLKKVECQMCKAIIREMHIEVVKHGMTKGGWGSETQVWETSNAMCLAMLQKYKLDMAKGKMEKKAEDEDEQMSMGATGADPAQVMRAMLVLKMGCSHWLEDYGSETSGFIYKSVTENITTPDEAASSFCTLNMNQCGKGSKEKKRIEREKEKVREAKRKELRAEEDKREAKIREENPFDKLPKDSQAGLMRMLEQARDDPLHYMEDSAQARIKQGQKDLVCDVCYAAIEQVHSEVAKRPKSMQREYDILSFADGVCEGGKDLSVPPYFGIDPPPLPPLWTDRYRPKLHKKSNKYILKSIGKKASKKRNAWRALTVDGKHKPPPSQEYEGDMMMTMSCKDAVEPAKIVEELSIQIARCLKGTSVKKGTDCEKQALAVAQVVCKSVDDSPCTFTPKLIGEEVKDETDASSPDTEKAEEPRTTTEQASKNKQEL